MLKIMWLNWLLGRGDKDAFAALSVIKTDCLPQCYCFQIPTAVGHPPYSGYPAQQGYVSKDPTTPGYGYPPAPN